MNAPSSKFDELLAGLRKDLPSRPQEEPDDTRFRDFVRLLHSSPDDAPALAATLVLTLWQVAGSVWCGSLPSMLLIHEGDEDVLDGIARVACGTRPPDPADDEGLFDPTKPQLDRQFMRHTAADLIRLAPVDHGKAARMLVQVLNDWREAKRNCFGYGRSGQYSRMWDDGLGLMSDDDGSIILRIERDSDHAAMREDVLNHPGRLVDPKGFSNMQIIPVTKLPAVSGSLREEQCDAALVDGILKEGLPFFFIPHNHSGQLRIKDGSWRNTVKRLADSVGQIIESPQERPRDEFVEGRMEGWPKYIEVMLRRRLRHMPAAYEFAVLLNYRRLPFICSKVALFMASRSEHNRESCALMRDLLILSGIGIAIGVESLAYHCHGFEIEGGIKTARSLLDHVRRDGVITRRQLLRKCQKLRAPSLDRLLLQLAAEGLVVLEGRHQVRAVRLEDFIASLSGRFKHADYLPGTIGMMEQWKD